MLGFSYFFDETFCEVGLYLDVEERYGRWQCHEKCDLLPTYSLAAAAEFSRAG